MLAVLLVFLCRVLDQTIIAASVAMDGPVDMLADTGVVPSGVNYELSVNSLR